MARKSSTTAHKKGQKVYASSASTRRISFRLAVARSKASVSPQQPAKKGQKILRSRLRAPKDVDASQGAISQHSKTWKNGTRQPPTPSLHHASQHHPQSPRQITASLVYHLSCKPRYSDMLLCPSFSSYLCTAQDMKIANPQPNLTTGSTTTGRCPILGRLSSTPNFYNACTTRLRLVLTAIPLCGRVC